jgi:hypothetical protein
VLLSLEFDDDWTDNPVVSRSWAITWDFKEAFDEAFDVSRVGAQAAGVRGGGGGYNLLLTC